MSEFKSLNGYPVKDEVARQNLENYKLENADNITQLNEAIVNESKARSEALENESKVREEAIKPLKDNAILIPSLTQEEKEQLFAVCNDILYYTRKYAYHGTARRNDYLNAENCYDDDGKIKINCGLFCQLVWAGVKSSSFVDKLTTFDGTLEKMFEWGYEFKFPYTKAYGLTDSTGKPLGFVQPKPDTLEGSYSFNSFYSEAGDDTYKQVFKTFTGASDLAMELYMMGCEVPISDIQTGDMIFFKDSVVSDGHNDYTNTNFRDICHSAIVGRVYDDENDFQIIESDSFYTNPVVYSAFSTTTNVNTIARLSSLHRRIVMVARHPHAFGKGGNVGNSFTEV